MSWIYAGITVVGNVGGALMSKQKAPAKADFKPVDVADEQQKAIRGNLANFEDAKTLTTKGNNAAQSEATRMMELAMPGFGALQKRLLAQANSDLDSQTSLPSDVQAKIQQFAAEKGVTRGTSGNFNGFSLVKDFGFNMLDWQQASRSRALNTLSTVFGMTPRVNPMSPMSMMVDPNAAISVAGANSNMQYNVDQSNNNASTAARNHNAALMGSAFKGSVTAIGGGLAGGAGGAAPAGSTPAPMGAASANTGQKFQPSMLKTNTPAPTYGQSVFGNTPSYRS
jgi:hypothetical protein